MSTAEQRRHGSKRLLGWIVGAAAGLAGGIALCALAVSWWLDGTDPPAPSDVIVLLAGGYARPFYAADLYARGYAPEVWISRPRPPDEAERLRELGIRFPLETDVNREVLLRKGVPPSRIRPFGDRVNSTAEEALALRKEYDFKGKRILLVTSRYHARRARRIFRRHLPGAQVRAAGTPYETFSRRWWRHKGLAQAAVLEALKTLYDFGGVRLITQP